MRSSSNPERTSLAEEPEETGVDGKLDGSNQTSTKSEPTSAAATGPEPGLFDLAHSRRVNHQNVKHDDSHIHGIEEPLSWRHLFKRPIVRRKVIAFPLSLQDSLTRIIKYRMALWGSLGSRNFGARALTTYLAFEKLTSCAWYFGGGLAVTMLSLALLGFCHKSLDADGSALIPHYHRLVGRLIVTAIFGTIPLANSLSSTALLAIYAGTLFLLVVGETAGKVGSRGSKEKIKAALHSQREDKPTKRELSVHPEHSRHVEAAVDEDHEHGLTEHELGEDDVGNEGALGNLRITKIGRRQRLAYAF
ncbi:hypothetical protein P7C70_g6433, partial [Phenoliferia sp. Uapishka_3]